MTRRNHSRSHESLPQLELLEPRLLLSGDGVGALANGAITATHSFSETGLAGTHVGAVNHGSSQISVDLSAISGSSVYRAILVHDRGTNTGTSSGSSNGLRIEAADNPGVAISTLSPRDIYFDVTDAVQRAVTGGYDLQLNIISFPGFYTNHDVRLDVTCDQSLPVGTTIAPVTDMTVMHRDGDTMVTWDEPLDLLTDPNATVDDYVAAMDVADGDTGGPQYRYRVYRSDVPIDATTIRTADLVDEISPLSNWNPYHYGINWRYKHDSVVPRLPVDDLLISEVDQGIYVRRSEGADSAYYAVSLVVDGQEDLSSFLAGGNTTSAAVSESTGMGMVLLRKYDDYASNEQWGYVNGPELFYYNKWEPRQFHKGPSNAMDYLVCVPDGEMPTDGYAVDVGLHAWGGTYASLSGWWYEAEHGSIYVKANQLPYDWWTAYHDNYGTVLPWVEGVDGYNGGKVQNHTQDRILSFLNDFVADNWTLDTDRMFVTGNSMGGSGSIMWGSRSPELFAYVNAWVGVYDPDNTPGFYGSFEGVYGRETMDCEYEDTGVNAWDQSGTRLEVPFTWHRGEVTAVA